ncbi:carboxypeptidase-like regulatory domain-containing protein [Foetidibacter luteolus]|uniref:carboxypeptidase-like regulatory domain-containing protein n=1 Tax=Foetidibacter luteolus TaxID=2608880 RepID=UPI00129A2AF9|nr:carboxypeptidase-like regulatory domain-containing protein [Foetidibacter luteolus]
MKHILLLPLLLLCIKMLGQDQVSGKVVSEKGDPLPGATVFIPNTSIGTVADHNGEFTLSKLPKGIFKVAASFVNFTTGLKTVPKALRSTRLIIRLKPVEAELKEVIIRKYDKDGWEKWGTLFSNTFIGESVYAQYCKITNTQAVHFVHNQQSGLLQAFADEPLIIENRALGYKITLELNDFSYDLNRNEVDYQVYSFFTAMDGKRDEMEQWEKNRSDVYDLSLMRFMRRLYAGDYAQDGFEVRLIERKPNLEKLRIQELYKASYIKLKTANSGMKEKNIIKAVEKSYPRDSLRYYRKILQQEDKVKRFHDELLPIDSFTSKTDSGTVIFFFNETLQVTHKKLKEPVEYYNYRNRLNENNVLDKSSVQQQLNSLPPVTELTLTQQIPVEINENGYFNNIDLFINGFWGWWEKLATKLPYEYYP